MDTNLFPKKLKKIRDKLQLKRTVIKVIIGVMVGIAGGIAGLSIATNFSKTKIEKTKRQTELETEKIQSLRDIEAKQVYLSSKLKSFEPLLKLQERYQAMSETVFALLPSGTTLENFEVIETGNLTLSGTLPGFPSLYELLTNIREPEGTRLKINKAEMKSVNFNSNTEISFDLELSLDAGGSDGEKKSENPKNI